MWEWSLGLCFCRCVLLLRMVASSLTSCTFYMKASWNKRITEVLFARDIWRYLIQLVAWSRTQTNIGWGWLCLDDAGKPSKTASPSTLLLTMPRPWHFSRETFFSEYPALILQAIACGSFSLLYHQAQARGAWFHEFCHGTHRLWAECPSPSSSHDQLLPLKSRTVRLVQLFYEQTGPNGMLHSKNCSEATSLYQQTKGFSQFPSSF